jgi:thioredoxin 1
MSTSPISESNFKTTIAEHADKLVVVDFWAEWCGPCKMLAPVLEDLSEKLVSDIVVYKLNTDENAAIAQEFQITSIPCCVLFKQGKEIHRIIGHKTAENFEAELGQFI